MASNTLTPIDTDLTTAGHGTELAVGRTELKLGPDGAGVLVIADPRHPQLLHMRDAVQRRAFLDLPADTPMIKMMPVEQAAPTAKPVVIERSDYYGDGFEIMLPQGFGALVQGDFSKQSIPSPLYFQRSEDPFDKGGWVGVTDAAAYSGAALDMDDDMRAVDMTPLRQAAIACHASQLEAAPAPQSNGAAMDNGLGY